MKAESPFWAAQAPEYKAAVAKRCGEALALCREPLTQACRERGYALAQHGSLARDIDLIAVPWVESAADPHDLAAALFDVIRECCGFATWGAGDNPEEKPHGRQAYAIVIGGGAYFDISIVSPLGTLA